MPQALVGLVAHLVEQQGQHNGQRTAHQDGQKVDGQRVSQQPGEIVAGEKLLKPLQAHPLAAPQAAGRAVVLEGDGQAAHGRVAENEVIHQAEQRDGIHRLIPLEVGNHALSKGLLPDVYGGSGLLGSQFVHAAPPISRRKEVSFRFSVPLLNVSFRFIDNTKNRRCQ